MAGEAKVRQYRAFIAYSHQDKRWAAWLHRRLEYYRVPHRLVGRRTDAGVIQRRLTPIFRDREELATANDLSGKITQALENSDNLIVICSPAAAESEWVNEEIRRFREIGRGSRIFCFVVRGQPSGEDHESDVGEGVFPAMLCGQGSAGREAGVEPVEPLAADVRPGKDGRGLALMKLIAGLLGVNLDELRRRELQRRNRRWAAITVLALAVMTATSLLALEATVQRGIAEQRRAQAESLVAFMLGNLRKELQPIGRLDLLDMVGKRALAYYASQDADSMDASSLERRAQALRLIGQVYLARGNLDEALAAFNRAESTTARLLARKPHDPERIYAHAQSVYYLALVAYQRGEVSKAEAGFRYYGKLAQRLLLINPDNTDWRDQFEEAYWNMGVMMYRKKKFRDASEVFRRYIAISSKLARRHPKDISKQTDLAGARAWYAAALYGLGDVNGAYRQRMMQLAIDQRLLASDPDNSNLREGIAICERALANLELSRGNLREATARSMALIKASNALVKQDATNTLWQELNAAGWINLAESRYARNEFAASEKAAARGDQLARKLLEKDPTVLHWQTTLESRVQLLLSRLASRGGRHEDALKIASAVASNLDAMPADKRSTPSAETYLLSAHLLQGDELRALHQTGSVDAWKKVIGIAQANTGDLTPEMRTTVAAAYLRLGDTRKARRILDQLGALGYRAPEFMDLKRRIARRHTEQASVNSP